MDDDNDYGAGRGGPLRTEADRLLQAKYHQKERERRKRNALSGSWTYSMTLPRNAARARTTWPMSPASTACTRAPC